MQDDPFHLFRRCYADGEGEAALRVLFPHPEFTYDFYKQNSDQDHRLLNYADALAYGWPDEARQTHLLVQDDCYLGPFGEALGADEPWLWQRSLMEGRSAPYALDQCEPVLNRRYKESQAHQARWEACKGTFPFLQGHATLLPLTYDMAPFGTLPERPAILMEPIRYVFDDRPTLLLFPDVATLQHCLAIEGVFAALQRPHCWFHLLDHHPTQTLAHQPALPNHPFTVVARTHRDQLAEALAGTPDQLATIGRQVAWELRRKQLGRRRQVAHQTNCHQDGWHSLHKSFPSPLTMPEREPRLPHDLARIAHVVPQVIDAGHAPTRLYSAILPYHTLETHLLITDEHVYRTDNYPLPRYYSDPSAQRGTKTLKDLSLPTWIGPHTASYQEVASLLAQELDERGIDAALFHTASPLMRLVASMCSTPCIALFDHGHLVPGFNLYFAATPPSQVAELGGPIIELPHAIDVQKGWEEAPYPLEYFGVPTDAQLMTTISYHLDNRLSDAMCRAIAEILARCPRAHYLPIGPVSDPDRIRAPFADLGVADRLRFLGARHNPSQLARSMHLYLNEFPFGSGLALLDAAGAGVPIVSMHDPKGPYQARAAGNFYGHDRIVTSGSPADYTDLACRLLSDPSMWSAWSERALAAYTARGDPKELAVRIECALQEWFQMEHANASH